MSGVWDNDSEGTFDFEETLFDEEDTDNPLVSQEYDAQTHSPVARVSGDVSQPVALVAVFDEQGLPMVARHVMNKGKPSQLEEFRRPTQDEYNSIMFGGKLVRGGVVAEPVPTGTGRGMQMTPLGQTNGEEPRWKKLAKWGIGLGAVGGAGYLGYRWWQNR